MLVEVAYNPDDPADQDRCGRDLRALEPMPGRDRNRDNRESSALVKLPSPSASKDVASTSRPFNSPWGLMEADRLNAPLADAGGGRQGQGRGGRGAEVRAAWGQQLIQELKVLVELRQGALQLAEDHHR